MLASSPSCFFQCNLIQFDVGRDLNLNIIAKKRQAHTGEKLLTSISPLPLRTSVMTLTRSGSDSLGSNIHSIIREKIKKTGPAELSCGVFLVGKAI